MKDKVVTVITTVLGLVLHRLEIIPSCGTCGLLHQKGEETIVQRPSLFDKGHSGLKWESHHLDSRYLCVPIPFS